MTFLVKGALISVLVFATLTVNANDGIITRLGLELGYGVIAVVSLLVATLLIGQTALMVALVVSMSLLANMPAEFVLNFGLDRDLYMGIATAVVLAPFACRALG
ncbi:MAG: hypothetical protein QGI68_20000 [Pseudomonadales bacterium]|jgi:hypothetical protein|nr:hypothetical protein [Pseudomonadales bacterium]MDP7597827.1 hypothetical protein [Pseudomonadales bacterium]HJN53295.1 hypothetical protein [Pseudomonadales bacterium]|tara:strand:- start:1209 stop:1520 length:312 start_codon:yes stop_codon:yes gene_type:complete